MYYVVNYRYQAFNYYKKVHKLCGITDDILHGNGGEVYLICGTLGRLYGINSLSASIIFDWQTGSIEVNRHL